MHRILITGGAGFVGSHVAERCILTYPDAHLTIFDKMTYAADFENVRHLLSRDVVRLVVGDIADFEACKRVTKRVDLVIHTAAESHVDNSFGDSLLFTRTNVYGTHTLMEACRVNDVSKVIHVSTDEVYGEVLTGSVEETCHLNPTNPYSASKAAAEMIVKAYIRTYNIPIITIRSNNIFGVRQYPEKIIPKFCLSLALNQKLTIHGNGEHVRHYLAAEDFAKAIMRVINRGVPGEIYNVGSKEGYTNLQIATMICNEFDKEMQLHVEFVGDRPFNDRRYSISSEKIEALGWRPEQSLAGGLPKIAQWYRDNTHRYRDL